MLKLYQKGYHIILTHENQYACNKCDFRANTVNRLKTHNEEKHGEQVICDKCDYTTTIKSELKQHKEEKHESWYACYQCEYTVKSKIELKKHMEHKHEEKVQQKTKLCYFYNKGNCKVEGNHDNFVHERPECKYGENCLKPECEFVHKIKYISSSFF